MIEEVPAIVCENCGERVFTPDVTRQVQALAQQRQKALRTILCPCSLSTHADFAALVALMHFFDAVCADPPKALAYAKQVKALAQKALDEAGDVLEDTTTSVA